MRLSLKIPSRSWIIYPTT